MNTPVLPSHCIDTAVVVLTMNGLNGQQLDENKGRTSTPSSTGDFASAYGLFRRMYEIVESSRQPSAQTNNSRKWQHQQMDIRVHPSTVNMVWRLLLYTTVSGVKEALWKIFLA